VEYAHFFAAMGTSVTLIEATERLVPGEEPEVAALLKHALRNRMQVLTDVEVEQIVRGAKDLMLFRERAAFGCSLCSNRRCRNAGHGTNFPRRPSWS